VQGVVDPGWAETERSNAGPAAAPAAASQSPSRAVAARSHTLASDLFVLSLFVGALVDLSVAHSHATIWPKVTTGLRLVQLVGAITVLVQRYRGLLRPPMQKLAIAALVLMGVTLYVQYFSLSFDPLNAPVRPMVEVISSLVVVVNRVADGIGLLLGFIGAVIILRGGEPAFS
jgi:hypothetical protein